LASLGLWHSAGARGWSEGEKMGKKKDVAPILSAMGVLTSIVTDLVKFVTKLGGTMEAIYRLATPEGAETLEKVAKVINDDFQKAKNAFLKLISGTESLVIEALDGKAIIVNAKLVFKSYIDSDFKNWNLDNVGQVTDETSFNVYEMTKNATFAQIFSSLADNLDRLLVTQSQIISFCEKYPGCLRQDGYGTFFLIKENGKYFVVNVHVVGDGLGVSVGRLEYDFVWSAGGRHRLVAPATWTL